MPARNRTGEWPLSAITVTALSLSASMSVGEWAREWEISAITVTVTVSQYASQ